MTNKMTRIATKATATVLLCLVSTSPLFASEGTFIPDWPKDTQFSDLLSAGILSDYSGGVAEFINGTHRCGKITVPEDCTKIVIPKNTTIEGSFYIPHNKNRENLLIIGRNRATSIITGLNYTNSNRAELFDLSNYPGTLAKHFSAVYASQRCENSNPQIKVTVKNLTSIDPCHFHFVGNNNTKMVVDNVDIISQSENDDAFGGGDGSILRNSFISVTDANVKVYSQNMEVRNCQFDHNSNGAPIQLGAQQLGNPSSSVTLENIIVTDRYTATGRYNHAVITWSGDDAPMVGAERHIYFEGSFIHNKTTQPGVNSYFWQFGANGTNNSGARYVKAVGGNFVKTYGSDYTSESKLYKSGSDVPLSFE